MSHYQTLTSEKYLAETLQQQSRETRREQNRAATRSLFQFVFAGVMVLAVLLAVETMSVWLPAVTDYVSNDLQRVNSFMQAQGMVE